MRKHRSDKSFHLEQYLPRHNAAFSLSGQDSHSIDSEDERMILEAARQVTGDENPVTERHSDFTDNVVEHSDVPFYLGQDDDLEEEEQNSVDEEEERRQMEKASEQQRKNRKRCWVVFWRVIAVLIVFLVLNLAILLTKLRQQRTENKPTPTPLPPGVVTSPPLPVVETLPSANEVSIAATPVPSRLPVLIVTEYPSLQPSTRNPTQSPTAKPFEPFGGFGFGGAAVLSATPEPTTGPTKETGIKIVPSTGMPSKKPTDTPTPEPINFFSGFGFGGGLVPSPTLHPLSSPAETPQAVSEDQLTFGFGGGFGNPGIPFGG